MDAQVTPATSRQILPATTARSLALLKLIDATLDVYGWLTEQFMADTAALRGAAKLIAMAEREAAIDPDGEVSERLDQFEQIVLDARAGLLGKTFDSFGDDADEARETTARLADAMADIVAASDECRMAIGEHDADLDPRDGKVYESAEALIAALKE